MAREVCMAGGMCGRERAWQWVCMAGGMHGSGVWQGTCMAGGVHHRGHAWRGGNMHGGGACVAGGVHGGGCGCTCGRGACVAGHANPPGYHEIWSMSGQYASYWNAFLFNIISTRSY